MMPSRRREKDMERNIRRVERQEREDRAGKLLLRAPDLTSLSIVVHETRPDGCVSDSHYTRRVVLEQAPALFEVPCSDPACEDGGYEVTWESSTPSPLASGSSRASSHAGGDAVRSTAAGSSRFVATATYAEAREVPALPRDA